MSFGGRIIILCLWGFHTAVGASKGVFFGNIYCKQVPASIADKFAHYKVRKSAKETQTKSQAQYPMMLVIGFHIGPVLM